MSIHNVTTELPGKKHKRQVDEMIRCVICLEEFLSIKVIEVNTISGTKNLFDVGREN